MPNATGNSSAAPSGATPPFTSVRRAIRKRPRSPPWLPTKTGLPSAWRFRHAGAPSPQNAASTRPRTFAVAAARCGSWQPGRRTGGRGRLPLYSMPWENTAPAPWHGSLGSLFMPPDGRLRAEVEPPVHDQHRGRGGKGARRGFRHHRRSSAAMYAPPCSTGADALASRSAAKSTSSANPFRISARPDAHVRSTSGRSPCRARKAAAAVWASGDSRGSSM